MMTFMPVNCCMSCKSMPSPTTRRTLRLLLNNCQPSCLTDRLSRISVNSPAASSGLSRRRVSTARASSTRPCMASQRGLRGRKITAASKRAEGMPGMPNIQRQAPEELRAVSMR